MSSEKKSHLDILLSENKEREQKKLIIINNPSYKKRHVILSFHGINEIFFLHKAFSEKNIQASKVFLYKIAMSHSYYYEKLNGEIFNVLNIFTYAVLSDNESLIKRIQSYNRTEHPDSFSTYFNKGIQSILKNDKISLSINIEGLKKWRSEDWTRNYQGIITTFEGFQTNDKIKIEQGLEEIVKFHDLQEQPLIAKDYINIEATALAKLAWRKGIKVKPASKLIPEELLPVNQLRSYENYDFFNELDGKF